MNLYQIKMTYGINLDAEAPSDDPSPREVYVVARTIQEAMLRAIGDHRNAVITAITFLAGPGETHSQLLLPRGTLFNGKAVPTPDVYQIIKYLTEVRDRIAAFLNIDLNPPVAEAVKAYQPGVGLPVAATAEGQLNPLKGWPRPEALDIVATHLTEDDAIDLSQELPYNCGSAKP